MINSCVSGKRSYHSQQMAEEALLEHLIKFNHPAGTGPINVYVCDDCGEWHFTSKGEMSPILKKNAEYIRTQQRARDWERKIR